MPENKGRLRCSIIYETRVWQIWKIIDLIHYLNHDKDCVGIIVQLPLPEEFKYKSQILSTISPNKDIDGMGGVLNGLSSIDLIFVPAAKAVVKSKNMTYTISDENYYSYMTK